MYLKKKLEDKYLDFSYSHPYYGGDDIQRHSYFVASTTVNHVLDLSVIYS